MKKRLVTSALPYVNNIPHLGNLIQVLSADVFARYCRLAGYETLYVCGTDEYGTATETRAREEGITPRELCTRYYKVHDDIYRWFRIAFDKFGRTSTPKHTEITQHIFRQLYENGYIREHTIEQLYSEESQMFLADRYVRGTCPHCGYEDARGDQCESCGKLLDPADLISPRSAVDNSTPVMKKSKHLYIDLPAIRPELEEWIKTASVKGQWSKNAVQMTQAWIRDGLKERGITRDLKWGIPVPLEGFQDKVFYVWFDAPIGYISITMNHTDEWEAWWRNPDEVELVQFVGKDNIPFHTVIFPSSLIGTGETWTMLHTMSSTEYLNYEGGQFSKSRGVGVFGNDAQDTGIPPDVWRFYIFYNRPETSDFTFTWDDFQEKTNGELIGNLANLVNRTLTFLHKNFDGEVAPLEEAGVDAGWQTFWNQVRDLEKQITDHLEFAQLRDAFRKVFQISTLGNRTFQAAEPWKTKSSDPEGTKVLLSHLVYLLRDLSVLIAPYIPDTAARIASFIGAEGASWAELGRLGGLSAVSKPEILFDQLTDELVAEMRRRFSGSQSQRKEREAEAAAMEAAAAPEGAGTSGGTGGGTGGGGEDPARIFARRVDLRAARIESVERHPKADKLYIETVDDGSSKERTIVSGLVPYYAPEDLQGRTVVLVSNLRPAKLRGVESQGMLLAASPEEGSGEDVVDVLFVDHASPGDRVLPRGVEAPAQDPPEIDIEGFFSMPISVTDGVVTVGERPLEIDGREVRTEAVRSGTVA
ncbi:MAG: methionine--tRNA ligase [Spirochaetaceae bacterium]